MPTRETLKPGIAVCNGEDIEQMSTERGTQKPGIAVYDGKDILGDNILMLLFVIVVQSSKFHVGFLADDTNRLHNTIIARMVFVHALSVIILQRDAKQQSSTSGTLLKIEEFINACHKMLACSAVLPPLQRNSQVPNDDDVQSLAHAYNT